MDGWMKYRQRYLNDEPHFPSCNVQYVSERKDERTDLIFNGFLMREGMKESWLFYLQVKVEFVVDCLASYRQLLGSNLDRVV
jgi:hypothetical protein